MKNPFKNYKLSNFKENWSRSKADPYVAAKMNYRFTSWLVYGLMLILGYTFFRLIISVNGGSSAYTLLLRGAMVVVGLIILSKMYFTILNPLKKTLDHYESNPTTITSHYVNTDKEIDEIFEHFEKKKQGESK